MMGLAVGLAAVGLAAGAAEVGERGLALYSETTTADQVQLAYARYALAKALWAANKERPRALALAADARKGFAAGGLAAFNGVVAIDKWYVKIGQKQPE
jgi:eukaryotic-like serine/threonine-protein kinase